MVRLWISDPGAFRVGLGKAVVDDVPELIPPAGRAHPLRVPLWGGATLVEAGAAPAARLEGRLVVVAVGGEIVLARVAPAFEIDHRLSVLGPQGLGEQVDDLEDL